MHLSPLKPAQCQKLICTLPLPSALACMQDPAVVAAVAELQSLKQQLARLEGLQEAFANGRQRPLHALLGGSVAEAAGAANDS